MQFGLKKAGAIFLLVSFMVQALYTPFLMIDYYWNTATYKRNCINKTRPYLHCDGKCQVMKKMAEHEKKEQENNETKGGKNELILSSKSFFSHSPSVMYSQITPVYACYNNDLLADISIPIFHPPCA